MLVRGVDDIHAVQEQAALLRIAMLVARDEPLDTLFATASEEVARLLGVDAGGVIRFIGGERAVIVGVHRMGGVRGLPVNAELDFDRVTSALGMARSTLSPTRQAYTGGGAGSDVANLMRSIGLRASVAAPVLHDGEAWGALIASATEEEQLPPGCEHRLVGIAGLLAQALVNADGRTELAASRARLVESGDEARRRLERSLHEGAHQHVVALALKLRVARGRAVPGSEEEALLTDVLTDAMAASAELGELARGLHPAVLSERGLAAALQVLAARAGLPVRLRELPGRRYPAVLETTAYLAVVEALANAVRHAHATEVTLRVADRVDHLVVEVSDDGIGGAAVKPGGGLECLADRAAAVGARFSLASARGEGTTVRLAIAV
ncbi:MAG TPA: GAF domain-containing protein [Solirubrobacter sp.]|nr:GAF domain-containing protein [Solirubrobacter sp.]